MSKRIKWMKVSMRDCLQPIWPCMSFLAPRRGWTSRLSHLFPGGRMTRWGTDRLPLTVLTGALTGCQMSPCGSSGQRLPGRPPFMTCQCLTHPSSWSSALMSRSLKTKQPARGRTSWAFRTGSLGFKVAEGQRTQLKLGQKRMWQYPRRYKSYTIEVFWT